MLRQLNVVILLFFCPKFGLYLYQVMNIDNDFNNAKILTYVEMIETFTMTFLLYVYRPRRQWPEFFWIGIGEADARNDRRDRESRIN